MNNGKSAAAQVMENIIKKVERKCKESFLKSLVASMEARATRARGDVIRAKDGAIAQVLQGKQQAFTELKEEYTRVLERLRFSESGTRDCELCAAVINPDSDKWAHIKMDGEDGVVCETCEALVKSKNDPRFVLVSESKETEG